MTVDSGDCTFRVLGPVQVIAAGGPVVFARRQQLDLLALLLLNADRVVTVEQIVDAMWGEAVPQTAGAQIKNMLSALRRSLIDGGRVLATVDRQPAGYRLRIVTGQLDLTLFNSLVAEARATAPLAARAELLRRALDLWRGVRALAGVRAAFAGAARTHLDEQRNTVLEALFDVELERGNHAKIIADLTEAVAANPGRERLVGQLMVALYRCGRPADALAAFRRARTTLIEEYGLEPGRSLRELERLILRGDPALAGATPGERSGRLREGVDGTGEAGASEVEGGPGGVDPAAAAAPAGRAGAPARPARPVPAQLPLDLRSFAGRGAELAQLNSLVQEMAEKPTTVVMVAVMGTAGVGKTALAVHWAHQIVERYPDGQLYVNLRGFDPGPAAMSPAEALRGFLDALAVPPEQLPADPDAQAALYRSLMVGRRMLVLLDNAVTAEQVRPLLPGAPGCLVIVTSRSQLSGLVATEGAHPLTLDVLAPLEARELLVGRLGADRVTAETGAAEEIAAQCARLPLALSVVAARAAIHPAFPLATLAAELADARGGLRALAGDLSAPDVRAAFSWSYRRLSAGSARLFRLLGLHPGPDVALPAAASLTGVGIGPGRPLLAELAGAHLVEEHVPGRYALHDLLRMYAREMASTVDSEGERRLAVRRLLDHYLHSAYAASLLIYPHRQQIALIAAGDGVSLAELPGREQAVAWFAAEHPVLVAAVGLAAEAGFGTHAWQLASAMAIFLHRWGHWHDWAATQNIALESARALGDRAGLAHANGNLGLAYTRLGRLEQAEAHLLVALRLLGELDDRIGQGYTHLRLASVHDGQGCDERALEHAMRALQVFQVSGHQTGLAQALNQTGWYQARLGRHEEAIVHCEQAVAVHRELADREGTAHALDSLGYAHHNLGRYREAAWYYGQALELLREAGDRYYESIALRHLGETRRAAGQPDLAREAWRQALDILTELGHRDADAVRAELGELRSG